MRVVRRAAIVGAGTMGSRIAAHFANAGIPSLLLDIVLPEDPDRDSAALRGIEAALKQKPGAFYSEAAFKLVRPGNLEDDIGGIQSVDWIVEAVSENIETKRSVLERIAHWRRPETIVSTNTSGIPLAQIADGFSPEFRKHFLGTHFFNPPRYLHLLELIPGPETDAQVLAYVERFANLRLGKGVVRSKDTPNFIANRVGNFFGATVLKIAEDDGYTIEEVEALTGPLIGLPRSATYRLMDIIGLDVWAAVARNLYEFVPEDPWRERFVPPRLVEQMLSRGWKGEKAGQGFYRRAGAGPDRTIEVVDPNTLEYRPQRQAIFESIEKARTVESLPERLKLLLAGEDRASAFLWKLLRDVFAYSASRVPEISDRVVEIDRAMRWGYAHKMGPFEMWDAVGVEATVDRMRRDGVPVPENVGSMLASGARNFYRAADSDGTPHTEYFDFASSGYRALEERPGVIVLAEVKRARKVIRKNAGASLIDLRDGVVCLELHGKANVLGEDQIAMICAGLDETMRNHRAMLVASQGENFSSGVNLRLILAAARAGAWDELDAALERFQQAMMAMKYAPVPVVAAPFGSTLGGGCELVLHASRVQASAELYTGLIEAGAGLIPAGGGCKEIMLRLNDAQKAMELIGKARVSTSGEEARTIGYLRPTDGITMNPERLIGDAKALALALAPAWAPGLPRCDIPVRGEAGYAVLRVGVWLASQGGHISEYDREIGEKLAHVLSGGRLTGPQQVSEQYILDLEREAFLSLCGQPKTQERMEHMLNTGRPLRN